MRSKRRKELATIGTKGHFAKECHKKKAKGPLGWKKEQILRFFTNNHNKQN
jgi:hypothetical protein